MSKNIVPAVHENNRNHKRASNKTSIDDALDIRPQLNMDTKEPILDEFSDVDVRTLGRLVVSTKPNRNRRVEF